MTEANKTTDPAVDPTKPAEQAAQVSKPEPQKAKPAKAEPKMVKYVSTAKHSTLIDIQVRGEMMYGYWAGTAGGQVGWDVPANLAEDFEHHYHFVVGNIKRAEAEPEKK